MALNLTELGRKVVGHVRVLRVLRFQEQRETSVRFNIINSHINEICVIFVSLGPAKWWWFWLGRGMFVTLFGVFELYYLTYERRSGCVGSDLQGRAW